MAMPIATSTALCMVLTLLGGWVTKVDSQAQEVKLLDGREAFYVQMSFGPSGSQSTATCILDTGSSNLAVAASNNPAFAQDLGMTYNVLTPNIDCEGSKTGTSFDINYVNGSWTGTLKAQSVSFTNNPAVSVANCAEFAAITTSKNFFNCVSDVAQSCQPWSCILGMGYQGLANGGALSYFSAMVDSGYSNRFALKLCHYSAFFKLGGGSMYFWPSNVVFSTDELTTQVLYTPIVKELYYEVKLVAMFVGGVDLALDCAELNTPGPSLIDTGTTGISVPNHVRQAIVKVLAPLFVKEQGPFATLTQSQVETAMFDGSCIPSTLEPHSLNVTSDYDLQLWLPLASDPSQMFSITVPPYKYILPCSTSNNSQGVFFNLQASSCDVPTSVTIGLAALSDIVIVFDRDNTQIGFGNPVGGSTCNDFRGRLVQQPQSSGGTEKQSCTSLGSSYGCGGDASAGIPTSELGLIVGCSVLGVLILGLLAYLVPKEMAHTKEKKKSYKYQNMNSTSNPLETKMLDEHSVNA